MSHHRPKASPMLEALLTLSLGLLVLGFWLFFKIAKLCIWCLVVSSLGLRKVLKEKLHV